MRVFALLALATAAFAAQDPVQWTLAPDRTVSVAPGSSVLLRLTATLEPGWHLYSPTTPKGGPIPTSLTLADSPVIASVHVYEPAPKRKYDPNFQLDTETFEKQVVFLVAIELKKDAANGPLDLTAQVRYQSCNDKECLPPKRKTASATITVDASAVASAVMIPAGYRDIASPSAPPATPPTSSAPAAASTPLTPSFLVVAFAFGLAAIFTPCVFPMIPITVSFFLNQQSGRRSQSLIHAIVYSAGIVVLFTSLGLAAKAIAGPIGLVRLGASPWVNGFIALIFIVFGLSLLGAFELTMPSAVLTRADNASRRGGYLGTLIMGLTFALTAFACVGPFVGPLLVASVQGGELQPVLGMIAFSSGLAAPFFLLALFPSFLRRLPRSGGWMVRVKVVFGFVILAAALKYLSVIDQQFHIGALTRERFLAAWVILFALPGLYLLGLLRLEGIEKDEPLGVGRTLVAALFLIFSLSLVPGMFGTRLGELDAWVPAGAQTIGSASANPEPKWITNQYREALGRARAENKLVLINFTGYACTNCHWMRANMFPRPEIRPLLDDFVLLELYTDGTDDASVANQQIESTKFNTVAIPFYAIVAPDETVIATFPGLTRNAAEFSTFLRSRPTAAGA
ncbi:MAG TPA: cytochrome c biogenesis protein CcdA [Bryobacteraceae bacterium]|nr:cytochrome c biogenesis protein CcdA [Bryobacteraceae bacterium]